MSGESERDCNEDEGHVKKKKAQKPKVVSEWSENDVFKLIACVQEHPALWDARDSQYRNKQERAKLWDEMSKNEFQSKYAGAELLAKWSNTRIQFRSYSNKKPKSGDAAPAPVNWKYFSAMQFIGHAECDQTALTESNLVFSTYYYYFFLLINFYRTIMLYRLILKAAMILF